MRKKDEVNKEELNEVISLSKKLLKISYFVFIAGLVLAAVIVCERLNIFWFIKEFLIVVAPFFIGFAIAWLLKPLVNSLNTKINNNTVSSLIVFSLFVVMLLIILYIFIPTLYNEVNELVGLLPSLLDRIKEYINNIFQNFGDNGLDLTEFKNNLLANLTAYTGTLAKDLPNNIIDTVSSLFSGIGTFVMGSIIGVYMLIDYDNLTNKFKNIFPSKFQKDINYLFLHISLEVRKVVYGTLLVALMVLVCDSVGFTIIGLNAPLLFGIFCGLTDLIPYIGPYVGGAVAVIVGFTQNPLIGIGTLIICVIVQIVESYILQPLVMSKASNIHPIVIIIGLLVFGHFFGIIGMVLATPILAIIKVLYEFTKEKLEKYSLKKD